MIHKFGFCVYFCDVFVLYGSYEFCIFLTYFVTDKKMMYKLFIRGKITLYVLPIIT